ncbi:hypothetical protein I5M32_02735 [Pedobacter sp. SD-b]|uniref:SGNH/GDSL hydrolase family protein n=1 Tax=Pedobacter segetis TaxID=2793069 RepID=A0ABS1BI41_9SPHI|nr:hypothetical protein [Pedobacter segetis]MBK0381864.1 hypothetical protein [Pedobacter segetis]
MKKFIIKSTVFLAILSVVFFSLSLTFKRKYNPKTDYLGAIIDKHQRLEQIDSNRLILIGGSNLAFGINSPLIEDNLKVNVINMGLHAGLGLAFMLNEVKPSVKKGDLIVLCLEYPLYLDDFEPDIDLISFTQHLYPPSRNYYHFNLEEMFLANFAKFKKRFEAQTIKIDPVFNRQKFDKYGDDIGHLGLPGLIELRDKEHIGKLEVDKSARLINQFNSVCKQKGAKLLISYVSYPKSEYKKNKKAIDDLNQLLHQKIENVPFINKPENYIFDDSLFYDTVYHLNREGRERRTTIFIKDIKPFIQK